jgi:hypothetical protein
MFHHSRIVTFEEFRAIDDFLEAIQEVFRGHLGWFLDIVGEIIHLRFAHVSFSTNLVTKNLDRILKRIFGVVAKCWITRLFTNDVLPKAERRSAEALLELGKLGWSIKLSFECMNHELGTCVHEEMFDSSRTIIDGNEVDNLAACLTSFFVLDSNVVNQLLLGSFILPCFLDDDRCI